MAEIKELKSENLKLQQSLEEVNETLAWQKNVNKDAHKINVDGTGNQVNIFLQIALLNYSFDCC